MRGLAVCGAAVPVKQATVTLNETPVRFGFVRVSPPRFDPQQHPHSVMIRVKGFACGYRDQTLIFNAAERCSANDIYVIGSDFVGEVVAVGANVGHLDIGQRVIGDNHWTGRGVSPDGIPEGIPTNNASYEYLVLHAARVMPIPEAMPDAVAAGFSLYTQTAYSLVRRLCITPEDRVLVTAARSNTALFVLHLLKARGIRQVSALTTTTDPAFHQTLEGLGAQVILVGENALRGMKFDKVIDPFFDIYLEQVITAIAPRGQYITCGLHTQHLRQVRNVAPMNAQAVMLYAMMHNISLMGNCLGETADLREALADYESGIFTIPIDTVITGEDAGAFIERTYNAPDSVGRVVYLYE